MNSSLLVSLVLLATCFADCPDGASYNANFKKCYLLMTTKDSFSLAEQYCNNIGGHLTSIQNAYENSYIADVTRKAVGTLSFKNFWIGANAIASPSNPRYVWTDGQGFNYTHWMQGLPQNNTYDLCVYMIPGTGDWVNNVCNEKNAFVCEFFANRTYAN